MYELINDSINQVFLKLLTNRLKYCQFNDYGMKKPAFVAVKHNIIETINACECTIFGDKVATLTNDANIKLRCKL